MTIQLFGQPACSGIAIGRAIVHGPVSQGVSRYRIEADQTELEIERLRAARRTVIGELTDLRQQLSVDTPAEVAAMLSVHLMLLEDEELSRDTAQWVREHRYNAEWALTTQLDVLSRHFAAMDDAYFRDRISDLEQVVDRMLRALRGDAGSLALTLPASSVSDDGLGWILVAHDLSPGELLQCKEGFFSGLITERGGVTSHTAIVARSLSLPAVVGARASATMAMAEDIVILDGEEGVVLIDPPAEVLAHYRARAQSLQQAQERRVSLRHLPSRTRDGESVSLYANIELPEDCAEAMAEGATGVGLFRTEFLFMGRHELPTEDEQYEAYRIAIDAMHGLPITIRTIDVGADKHLDSGERHQFTDESPLGLRAIRFSLANLDLFQTQLRAVLRAACHGKVKLLLPMITNLDELEQSRQAIARAQQSLADEGRACGHVAIGIMVEVPAVAVALPWFTPHVDFLSVGTNDLMQYMLAVDRVDSGVSHLHDPLHPAVLHLLAGVIATANQQNVEISVCGELAGDPRYTQLLLGMGLRIFSMHPAQLLKVKERVLQADTTQLQPLVTQLLACSSAVQRAPLLAQLDLAPVA